MAHSILIAEDETMLAKILESKLKKTGFTVKSVSNGKDALEELTKNPYDLLVLDLIMPEMDGWTVLETLKGQDIKIIVTSNLSEPEDIKRARELGALDFLVKSNTPMSQMIEKIKHYTS